MNFLMGKNKYRFLISVILSIVFILNSCESIKRTVRDSYQYELYIDYKYISYGGDNGSQHLYFEIDSTQGMWYYGKLVVNSIDTYHLKGFEKGNHYVTTYKKIGSDDIGRLEIWSSGAVGQIRDSITIEDPNGDNGIVKGKMVMYRQKRR